MQSCAFQHDGLSIEAISCKILFSGTAIIDFGSGFRRREREIGVQMLWTLCMAFTSKGWNLMKRANVNANVTLLDWSMIFTCNSLARYRHFLAGMFDRRSGEGG